MARNMYGATSADFTLTSGGRVVPGATLTIWSARTGGTQITDLLDVDSVATTTVTSDADGSIVYYGPNNDKTVHWADSGVGSRIAIRPVDITGDPPVLSIGTVGTGAAAASLTGTSEAPVLNLTLPSAGANGVNTAAIQDAAVTSAKIADGTIVDADINASAAIAGSKLSGDAAALTSVGSAPTTATLGSELGDGVSLTQALTGLTIGAYYQVAAVSGTMTAATLDGSAMTCVNATSSFVATATSHTVVGTAGTATAISVKQVTARSAALAASLSGAQVSKQADASSNLFVGTLPLTLTTGGQNIGVGHATQSKLMTSAGCVALGYAAQQKLYSGIYNTGLGNYAQNSLTTGSYNNAIGVNAQYSLTTGSYNNAIGVSAQANLTTGSYNTALGRSAGSNITVQSGTVCIGVDYSGTAAQASADNDFVLGTGLHKVLIPGSLETTGNDKGVIVRSPNGTRWRLGVSNAGAVTVVAA